MIGFFCFIILELYVRNKILSVNKKFQWLIVKKDEKPNFSEEGLKKFFSHGYDPELGWIRKPNTEHTENGKYGKTKWHIDKNGSRNNINSEYSIGKISCYGDSFTFSRQVNDDETWIHFLSKLTRTNIQNFGVGNYGLDQSLLRLKREFKKFPSEIVIMGVVPDTISRILSVWKHYYEYGNTFGFKPRFIINNNKLVLIKNLIDSHEKFLDYKNFLKDIQKNDFFYRRKFQKEIIKFPYSITILKNFNRNYKIIKKINSSKNCEDTNFLNNSYSEPMKIIMSRNLQWRIKLFRNNETCELLKKIIQEYVKFSKKENFCPVFIFLPQKDDIKFIKNNYNFYEKFLKNLEDVDGLVLINITNEILKIQNINELFSDKTEYGGHYSKEGNEIIANLIFDELKKTNKL